MFKQAGRFMVWFLVIISSLAATALVFRGHFVAV